MRIQNNITAMTAHRNMGVANSSNARSQEKLSSGLRINRAGDDAAGLSISEKMRGQIRGLNQASRNAQDGISLLQTAEGALNETQNILQRMRELSVQAANDTNTQTDRNAIASEIGQLFEEIDRIASTTQFNEMNLLDGSFGCSYTAEVAAENMIIDRILSLDVGDLATTGSFTAFAAILNTAFQESGLGEQAGLEGADRTWANFLNNVTSATPADAEPLDLTADERRAIVDGMREQLRETLREQLDDNAGSMITALTGAALGNLFDLDTDPTNLQSFMTSVRIDASNDQRSFHIGANSGQDISVSIANSDSSSLFNVSDRVLSESFAPGGAHAAAGSTSVTFAASGGVANIVNGNSSASTAERLVAMTRFSNSTAGAAPTNAAAVNTGSFVTPGVTTGNPNAGIADAIIAAITATEAFAMVSGTAAGSTSEFHISAADARNMAIDAIDQAIGAVSERRSDLGSVQNRLEHTIRNLDVASENLQSAESRIRDVDMAAEVMEQTRTNILQQAAQSMLAMANQQPQSVLQLLG